MHSQEKSFPLATTVGGSQSSFKALTATASNMDSLGSDFNVTGSVMTKEQLEEIRKRRGECVTCGQKCFKKKLFKMVPIDEDGKVLNGRCLQCKPLLPGDIVESTTSSTTVAINTYHSASSLTTARSTSATSVASNSNNGEGQPVVTAAVSRRVTNSQVDVNRFSRTRKSLHQRSTKSLQNSSSGGSQQLSVSTPVSSRDNGHSSSFHARPPASSLARHSFNTATSGNSRLPPPAPPRARSERSLSSIGSSSVVSGNMSAARATPTLPGERRMLAADLPPTTPIRSGSLSPGRVARKKLPEPKHDASRKRDTDPGMPPSPWAPPSLSPFVTEGKHQFSEDSKCSPTSVASPPSRKDKQRASMSHQGSSEKIPSRVPRLPFN
jgi:hypothetical protein